MPGPVLLVCSPNSGSARPADEATQALRDAGVEVARVVTVDQLPDEPPGQAWAREGITAVIAAGGDGTIGAVVTAIGDAPLTLGILPLGTCNDTARSLQLPLGLDAAVVIAHGHEQEIDVGEVVDANGRRARFLHAATVGLNADFARLATDATRRGRLGALTYPITAVEVLAGARVREIRVRLDDREDLDGTALQVAAINLPHLFGDTLGVDLPRLGPRDGKLVVLVVRTLLKVERYECRSLELDMEGESPVTLDGELAGPAPARIGLVDRRLRVLLPAPVADPGASAPT